MDWFGQQCGMDWWEGGVWMKMELFVNRSTCLIFFIFYITTKIWCWLSAFDSRKTWKRAKIVKGGGGWLLQVTVGAVVVVVVGARKKEKKKKGIWGAVVSGQGHCTIQWTQCWPVKARACDRVHADSLHPLVSSSQKKIKKRKKNSTLFPICFAGFWRLPSRHFSASTAAATASFHCNTTATSCPCFYPFKIYQFC